VHKRKFRQYYPLIALNIWNFSVFARFQGIISEIPNQINRTLNSSVLTSILSVFGVHDTYSLTNFVNGLPWGWIVVSVALSVLYRVLHIVGKILVIGFLLVVGFMIIKSNGYIFQALIASLHR